jgi:hypothetical protein
MTLSDLLHVTHEAEFDAGIRQGVRALALAAAVGAAWRVVSWRVGSRSRPAPVAGLALAGAGALAMHDSIGLPDRVGLALVLLGAGGTVVDLLRVPTLVMPAVAAPSAWLLATHGDLVQVPWIRVLVGTTVVVGAWSAADFDRRWRDPAYGSALVVASLVGVYGAVPDTEHATALLGAGLLLALLAWPVPLASLGAGGAAASVGLMAWTVGADGFGRTPSIVGGVACLGLLVVEPVARLVSGGSPLALAARPRWAIVPVGAHLLLVLVASRLAGVSDDLPASVVIVAVELVAAVAAVAWLGQRRNGQRTTTS